jgi:putative chitinase
MVTAEQLKKLGIGPEWVDALNATFEKFGIDTPLRQASFIGQCSHESGNFRLLEENLNYKPSTLMRIWPSRFKTMDDCLICNGPRGIANKVYANRMGNRDEKSGDGYRFRGRGCIQLTGHANYFHAGQACGVDFVMEPDLVATPMYAAMTAGWFWSVQKLNAYADKRDFLGMTKKINGGTIGLNDRIKHITDALEVLSS